MEALSLRFGALNPGKPVQTSATAINTQAVSITVPLFYVVTGVVALFTAFLLIAVRPDVLATYHYNQYVISVTHLVVLGWLASITMGAMYQLVPVALETTLHNPKLGRWSYAFHLIGVVGMVWMFWNWNMHWVGIFGSLVTLGVGLFVYNIARTLKRAPNRDVVAGAVLSAIFWFSLTISGGLYAAAVKIWDLNYFQPISLMHAHAHIGALGFFTMMIVGVSYKLIPMFCLSAVQSVRRAWWSVALLNVGIAGLSVSILLNKPWKILFAGLVAVAIGIYMVELRAILRARARRVIDGGVKLFLTGIALLIPLVALGIVLSWPGLPATAFTTQLENVYGFVGLGGFVTFAILGMLYKIIPFLIWFHCYSKEIGRSKVPSLNDLYSARLQSIAYWVLVPGLILTSVATALGHEMAVRCSAALFLAGVAVFAVNLGKMLRHLWSPSIEPLNPNKKI